MSRASLLQMLGAHQPATAEEAEMTARVIAFVQAHEDCFERSLPAGHITGSAWVLDHGRTHVLLTHHQKLDKWLQLGGHADGDPDTLAVALREAREESGLSEVHPLTAGIFDVDVHLIPARKSEPEHFHYDIRHLLLADRRHPLRITSESKDLRWVPIADVARLTREESMLRMVRKTTPLP